MKKYILLSIFTVSGLAVSFAGEPEGTPDDKKKTTEVNKERTFGDLTAEEKKEAITHMLATGDCEWNGIALKGKVQFVESFPDIKIQYVSSFPDIKVKWVTSFPDDCGEWQKVTSFPDFKVQVVTSFPDIKVQEVTSFPGMD